MAKDTYKVSGMTCTQCAKTITKSVKKIPGVNNCDVNVAMNSMVVDKDPSVSDDQVIKAVKRNGYGAQKINMNMSSDNDMDMSGMDMKNMDPSKKSKMKMSGMGGMAGMSGMDSMFSPKLTKNDWIEIIKTIISGVLTIPLWAGMILNMTGSTTAGAKVVGGPIFGLVLSVLVLIVGYQYFIDTWAGIKNFTTNMSFLIVMGALAAFGLSLYGSIEMHWHYVPHNGENWHELYYETIGTIFTLMGLGMIFQNVAKKSTTSALNEISQLIPNTTTVLVDGKKQIVNSNSLKIGDIVVVNPGEKIATDGIITSGNGYTNESLISGESKPIKKAIGSKVVAGSVLDNGSIEFKVTKPTQDNTVNQIVKLVSEAQIGSLKIGKLVDKVSSWFVPIIVFLSLMTFMGWAIHGHVVNSSHLWRDAIVNAISVLVVACPCALGFATPTAVMVGTGKASQAGIVFKNGNQLENLAKLKAVVFDKTGTLTDGKMTLDKIIQVDKSVDLSTIQEYLKSIESNSQHPLAVSLVNSLAKTKTLKVTNFMNMTSKGVMGSINGKEIKVGSVSWLVTDSKITKQVNDLQQQGKSVFVMTVNNKVTAIVSLSDHIKPDAKELITKLNELNIKTIMVTGDNALTANYVAKELGIKEVHSNIPVTEKANFVAALQDGGKTKRGKQIHNVVAMVGDGINDTVALTKADIGITMSSSLDAAIASSDIILVNNKLIDIYQSVIVSRKTYNKIIGNLFWALIYNAVMVPLAAFGILRPEYSAIAMAMSSICVVLNSLLLGVGKITNTPKHNWLGWLYLRKSNQVSADKYDKQFKAKQVNKQLK